jgi:hypothetical protein
LAALTQTQLDNAGLSLRQLEELTGIGYNRLHRAIKNGDDTLTNAEREILALVLRAATSVPDRITLIAQRATEMGKVYVRALEEQRQILDRAVQ